MKAVARENIKDISVTAEVSHPDMSPLKLLPEKALFISVTSDVSQFFISP